MVSKNVFVKAALITAILLLISITIGSYIEGSAYSKFDKEILRMNENSEAILIMQSFSSSNDPKICSMISSQIDAINSDIYSFRSELEREKSTSILMNYDAIKRRYFIANARLLALTKQYNNKCNGTDDIILFFYISEKDCPECYVQGKALDDVRNACKNAKIFSFPIDADMQIIKSFMAYYGIEHAPAIIIDKENEKDIAYRDLVSAPAIMNNLNCKGAD